MPSNDPEGAPETPAAVKVQTADDPLSSKETSDANGDDRSNPVEESFTDESNALGDSNDAPARANSKMNSLDIDDGGDVDDEDARNNSKFRSSICCFGLIKSTETIGNMRILFPEYFYSSGWGVVGPHIFGPVIVWLILFAATHGVIGGCEKHNLGTISIVICYLFFAVSTYRLLDVCYRDPGICLDQEIPGHEPPERAREYRFCDRCKVWQPPDGVHSPECNVCVAGYDHHCVWMGTTIGKRNYRQFVKFNMTWLFYILYAVFWVAAIGPLVMNKK